MRYKIYYVRYTSVQTMTGMQSTPTLEYLKTVEIADLHKELKEQFGLYVSLWIKPVT